MNRGTIFTATLEPMLDSTLEEAGTSPLSKKIAQQTLELLIRLRLNQQWVFQCDRTCKRASRWRSEGGGISQSDLTSALAIGLSFKCQRCQGCKKKNLCILTDTAWLRAREAPYVV